MHETDESVVWWGLRGQVSAPATHTAIYVFLAFAFVLPFLVALALFGVETVRGRRRWMLALLALGAVTSVVVAMHLRRVYRAPGTTGAESWGR